MMAGVPTETRHADGDPSAAAPSSGSRPEVAPGPISSLDELPFAEPKVTVQDGQTRLELDGERVGRGLAQLVLTVVRLLHELLERQAIRRIDAGSLTEDEIERLGRALMAQSDEIRRAAELFGLSEQELNLDLGPLGRAL